MSDTRLSAATAATAVTASAATAAPSAAAVAASAAAVAASFAGAPVVARMVGAGALVARGPDAGPFLHGQLANDVTGLPTGRATRSLLLNHRGHAMAEAVVARDQHEWLVVVEDGMTDWVEATLAEHIIFDDVTLSRATAATVTVQGAGALAALKGAMPSAVLDQPSDAGPLKGAAFWRGVHPGSGLGVIVYPRRRSAAGGYDLTLLAADDAAATLEAAALSLVAGFVAAGALEVTAAAIDAARVAAGVTTAGRDGGAGVLPQEADLTEALSYRKGCYLGQEVMARIEARGSLKRGLATLEFVPLPGDEVDGGADQPAVTEAGGAESAPLRAAPLRAIELNGRSVGVLGTTALMPDGRVRALAVVRQDLEDGTVVTAGGRELRLVRSPGL